MDFSTLEELIGKTQGGDDGAWNTEGKSLRFVLAKHRKAIIALRADGDEEVACLRCAVREL